MPYTSLSFCSLAPLLGPRLKYMDRRRTRAGWVLAVDSGIQACGVLFRGKLIVAFSSRFVKEYIAMMRPQLEPIVRARLMSTVTLDMAYPFF